jgi:hypothetical protein
MHVLFVWRVKAYSGPDLFAPANKATAAQPGFAPPDGWRPLAAGNAAYYDL